MIKTSIIQRKELKISLNNLVKYSMFLKSLQNIIIKPSNYRA